MDMVMTPEQVAGETRVRVLEVTEEVERRLANKETALTRTVAEADKLRASIAAKQVKLEELETRIQNQSDARDEIRGILRDVERSGEELIKHQLRVTRLDGEDRIKRMGELWKVINEAVDNAKRIFFGKGN